MLPWGYVAHGDAASPASPLAVTLTVAPAGVVHELVVRWGSGPSAWRYTVSYRGLGETAPIETPADAEPLRRTVPGDAAAG